MSLTYNLHEIYLNVSFEFNQNPVSKILYNVLDI